MTLKMLQVDSKRNKLTITTNKKNIRIEFDKNLPRAVIEDMTLYFLLIEQHMPCVKHAVYGEVSSSRYLKGKEFQLSNKAENKHYTFNAKGELLRITGEKRCC